MNNDREDEFDELEEEWIGNSIKFMIAAGKTCVERGKQYEFECPVCGGVAVAIRAEINGHIHAHCKTCGMQVMQ